MVACEVIETHSDSQVASARSFMADATKFAMVLATVQAKIQAVAERVLPSEKAAKKRKVATQQALQM